MKFGLGQPQRLSVVSFSPPRSKEKRRLRSQQQKIKLTDKRKPKKQTKQLQEIIMIVLLLNIKYFQSMFIDECRNENSAVDVVSNNHFFKNF